MTPNPPSKLLTLLLPLLAPLLALAANEKVIDLHIAGSPQARMVWLVEVMDDNQPPIPIYTDVYTRAEGSHAWVLNQQIPTSVQQICPWGEQLIVLLKDGNWLIVGQSSGQALPDGRKILTLAADRDIWAIGEPPAAATRPTTNPATASTSQPTTQPTTLPTGRMLYLMQNGKWIAKGQLPAELQHAPLALGIAAAVPTAAAVVGEELVLLQFQGDAWNTVARTAIEPGYRPESVLHDGGQTFIYAEPTNASAGPAKLLAWSGAWKPAVPLPAPASIRALGYAGGFLRYVYIENNIAKERRLDPRTLQIDGQDEVLNAAEPSDWRIYNQYIEWSMIGIAILVMAYTYQMRDQYEKAVAKLTRYRPAPYRQRIFAGLIDALPFVGGIFYARMRLGNIDTALDMYQSPQAYQMMMIAMGVWVLYTTLAEVIFGRSIGKMIARLYVVRFDGTPASLLGRLLRNVLRIVDFMLPFALLLIYYLPLRQRIGDLAGNTFVAVDGQAESKGPDA